MYVIDWLLDAGDSDPAIRWQVMRDLLGRPEPEWSVERARVETEGWGALLLAQEDDDGPWAGGAYFPADFDWNGPEAQPGAGQPWTATTHVLTQLREYGLEPGSRSARRAVDLIGANCRWDAGDQSYWEGEVEPCINGQTVANGSYFGADVAAIVERLVAERLDDGGWNCEAANGSLRSSFDTTINVLDGLLAYEAATGGTPASREARRAGETYLLERELYKRRSTGEPADEDYLQFRHPSRWQHDVLRGLDYFWRAARLDGMAPDPRLVGACDVLRGKRAADGVWLLDKTPKGRVWFEMEQHGAASRWLTLRALRVLDWVDA